MLKRKTTVKYHSHVFDCIFHMPCCIINWYLKCLSPFIEFWCCKKNALSFVWIHPGALIILSFVIAFFGRSFLALKVNCFKFIITYWYIIYQNERYFLKFNCLTFFSYILFQNRLHQLFHVFLNFIFNKCHGFLHIFFFKIVYINCFMFFLILSLINVVVKSMFVLNYVRIVEIFVIVS